MPNIKSAKKRVKVTAVKTLRNKAYKSALRTSIKKAQSAVSDGAENKADAFKAAVVKIDKAVSKGILHKNTAAHKKSKLAKAFNQAQ
ncbi:30S ribosomal protein S20 [Ethanoligenens harbinense]|uniref:Small ribosomal subunit protein bS20 n=1 Tax=Ethanoligenens harbinense (strain DSM 18485 / JCM 12961 / CGMCC 1.5033 / YUAN-3) TaxID=663278 RepID=E6U764_ETHHY|nr:30S ribosomal protein S20 [Ethanoligenens harbinense]ADU28134.1 ribosomal protein S20 [Ethanoligenens harbinense YUAN-3]AVQ97140.1 30S ribosomal protein S20 [Ethanoligenens harbinense YUAN-3]AYF39803.1 30S ribosomal protein S20 [Ethanoligenens harbinense]AYF42635.1 30S ribosomal protein S20 [Ethanoligenens harbinense]QCN93384.1 30S ribosomal protein S20 [Ethanoligenens harbinense]